MSDIQTADWDDGIEWDEEELLTPACDLENPELCESCQ